MPAARVPPKRNKARGNVFAGGTKNFPLSLFQLVCVVIFVANVLYTTRKAQLFNTTREEVHRTPQHPPVKKPAEYVLGREDHSKLYVYMYDELSMRVQRIKHKTTFVQSYVQTFFRCGNEYQHDDFDFLFNVYEPERLYKLVDTSNCNTDCLEELQELEKLIDSWCWFALGYSFRYYNDMKSQLLVDERYTYYLHNGFRELFLLNRCFHGNVMSGGTSDPRVHTWQACAKTHCRTFTRQTVVDNTYAFEQYLRSRMDLASCGFVCVVYEFMTNELQYPHNPRRPGFYDLVRDLVPHCTFVNSFCEGMLVEDITKAVVDFHDLHIISPVMEQRPTENLCWTAVDMCLNISSLVGCASLCYLVLCTKLQVLWAPVHAVSSLSVACCALSAKACTALTATKPVKQPLPVADECITGPMRHKAPKHEVQPAGSFTKPRRRLQAPISPAKPSLAPASPNQCGTESQPVQSASPCTPTAHHVSQVQSESPSAQSRKQMSPALQAGQPAPNISPKPPSEHGCTTPVMSPGKSSTQHRRITSKNTSSPAAKAVTSPTAASKSCAIARAELPVTVVAKVSVAAQASRADATLANKPSKASPKVKPQAAVNLDKDISGSKAGKELPWFTPCKDLPSPTGGKDNELTDTDVPPVGLNSIVCTALCHSEVSPVNAIGQGVLHHGLSVLTPTAITQPSKETQTAHDAAHSPNDAARSPSDAARSPSDAAQSPNDAARSPNDAARSPTGWLRRGGSDRYRPSLFGPTTVGSGAQPLTDSRSGVQQLDERSLAGTSATGSSSDVFSSFGSRISSHGSSLDPWDSFNEQPGVTPSAYTSIKGSSATRTALADRVNSLDSRRSLHSIPSGYSQGEVDRKGSIADSCSSFRREPSHKLQAWPSLSDDITSRQGEQQLIASGLYKVDDQETEDVIPAAHPNYQQCGGKRVPWVSATVPALSPHWSALSKTPAPSVAFKHTHEPSVLAPKSAPMAQCPSLVGPPAGNMWKAGAHVAPALMTRTAPEERTDDSHSHIHALVHSMVDDLVGLAEPLGSTAVESHEQPIGFYQPICSPFSS